MRRAVVHLALPALLAAAFFLVASLPVQVLGCRLRGMLALSIALTSGLIGLMSGMHLLKRRMRGDPDARWWFGSTLILTVPVVALLLLL